MTIRGNEGKVPQVVLVAQSFTCQCHAAHYKRSTTFPRVFWLSPQKICLCITILDINLVGKLWASKKSSAKAMQLERQNQEGKKKVKKKKVYYPLGMSYAYIFINL